MNGRTQIYAALIAAASVLGAAWISTKGVRPSTPPTQTEPTSVRDAEAEPSEALRPTGLTVTGVQIGVAPDQLSSAVPQTRFAQNDVVSVSIHFTAENRVRHFPVRLSTRIAAAAVGWGDVEQTADIAEPGDSFRTLRFQPEPRELWMPGKHFVTVSVDGQPVYSQEVDIGGTP